MSQGKIHKNYDADKKSLELYINVKSIYIVIIFCCVNVFLLSTCITLRPHSHLHVAVRIVSMIALNTRSPVLLEQIFVHPGGGGEAADAGQQQQPASLGVLRVHVPPHLVHHLSQDLVL